MQMTYLKVFTDFAETIACLTDEEAGRLFRAMLGYAATGAEAELSGNERYLWVASRQAIDREAEFLKKQRENGAKGGRPKAEKTRTAPAKTAAKQAPEKPNETQRTQKDKDKEKESNCKEALSKESGKKADFLPPTPEEVAAFVAERGLNVDAAHFHRFYTEGGWRDSRGKPVRNWRQKLLSWQGHEFGKGAARPGAPSAGRRGMGGSAPYAQTRLSEEEFDDLIEVI
ncbi:MAG: DUF6291 domain-containing protein [Clostridia bacterium]|nr:DUF6291 domain-containing protein [Clostridia bacterium]